MGTAPTASTRTQLGTVTKIQPENMSLAQNTHLLDHMASVEVTVTQSTAKLAEASPPAMPLTMRTARTAKTGT